MSNLDWSIIITYMVFLIWLGWYLGRRQTDTIDYYLGSRKLPWWGIGFSTMATQLGAISFISAPAFVGLRPKGGLIWLGYEFAVPFVMIILVYRVIPIFHKLNIVSIYEYLEMRFDRKTRTLVSIIFLVSRGLATGVGIYAAAIVVSVILNVPLILTVIIIGTVALIYDFMGGIKAVIYSDVIQMAILFLGIIICTIYGLFYIDGWSSIGNTLSRDRLVAVNYSLFGINKGEDFGFYPLLFGGFFLYLAYYGFDQSQVQREISARSVSDSRKSLFMNGIVRYPLVLSYCILGLVIGTFALKNHEFMDLIPAGSIDYMVPLFVVNYLPSGLKGVIVIAILAASMSTLDSALNSLSASTTKDIIKPYFIKDSTEDKTFLYSKLSTLFWGVFCTTFAFLVGKISETVLETINMIGSIFYGPIAAVFLLGMTSRKTTSKGVFFGCLVGVIGNVAIALGALPLSWLWWNVTGFVLTAIVGYTLSLLYKSARSERSTLAKDANHPVLDIKFDKKSDSKWVIACLILLIYGIGIIIFSTNIDKVIF
jgi:SSS family transporter